MITISLCMIVKNEEDVLGRCLNCVRDIADEIIIVDTGSTDNTKAEAGEYTDLIYPFDWTDDFSAARNYAFSQASMDYCMWLDADDVIGEKDREALIRLKETLSPDTDIVMMRYHTAFDENGVPSFWYYRERLIRNNRGFLWQGAVHEVITPSGNIVYSEIAITHQKERPGDPDRNLNIYNKMISRGQKLNTREQYYYARELYYHEKYGEAAQALDRFLGQDDAWIENKIEACLLLSHCLRETNDRSASLKALLQSLEYDAPRAEICCELGSCFLEAGQYETAIFWFKTALNCDAGIRKDGFVLADCYHYIPALQLCVCYDKLGRYEEAAKYNEEAGSCKPSSPAYLYNKTYFDKKKKEI